MQHVAGQDKGNVLLYALSTCIWCKKTKRLLKELGVAYDFIDVDLLDEPEKSSVQSEVKKWNPRGSYPTIVLNDKTCITGFEEQKIREALS